jgi:hypothetical protein
LILLFCVLLLANELMKSGKSPFELSSTEKEPTAATQAPVSTSQLRESAIYVISADGATLVPERRSIPFGDFTVDNCRAALEELKKPTQGGTTFPALPPSAEVNAVYLLPGGELVIDFASSLQRELPKSASAEALMVYGVVNTLTQDALKGAKTEKAMSVRFLIDGAVPRESFPAHLDLSKAISPDPQWILKTEAAQ